MNTLRIVIFLCLTLTGLHAQDYLFGNSAGYPVSFGLSYPDGAPQNAIHSMTLNPNQSYAFTHTFVRTILLLITPNTVIQNAPAYFQMGPYGMPGGTYYFVRKNPIYSSKRSSRLLMQHQ